LYYFKPSGARWSWFANCYGTLGLRYSKEQNESELLTTEQNGSVWETLNQLDNDDDDEKAESENLPFKG